jgi:integrase
MQAWVSGLSLAASSVRPVWGTVRAVIRAAVRDRLIGTDPCLGVKLPELPVKRIVPLEREQVEAIVEAVPRRYRGLLVMDAATGLRQGEAFGVQLTDDEGPVVDFLRRQLRVARQVQPKGSNVVICGLKNRASYRTVPLGQVALVELGEHIREFPPAEVEIVDETDPAKPLPRKVRLLFTDDDGQPLNRGTFNTRVWKPAIAAAAAALRKLAAAERDPAAAARLAQLADGLRADGADAVTMHDLRHWFASVLIFAGLNVKVVAERLGHADAAMTLRVYTHLFPSDDDRTREAVDEAFKIQPDVPTVRPQIGS